jgi:hypothetical protein
VTEKLKEKKIPYEVTNESPEGLLLKIKNHNGI